MIRKQQGLIADNVRNNFHLTSKQLQICYGGLLGDSNINVRQNGKCRIKFGHSEKQLDYLEYKKKIVEPFIIQKKPTIEPSHKTSIKGREITCNTFYIYTSIVHQDFTNIYGLLYHKQLGKSVRNITMRFLSNLDPLAILIWYLDDGTLTRDKESRIYSLRYSLSEHRAIKKWFWHKHQIEIIIAPNNRNHNYYIRFNVSNTKKLFNLFREYIPEIPECMHYKFIKL